MPRINPYTSSPENLNESTRGAAAWEQAGRRLGPLYNEAAQFQKEQGAAIAQGIRQMTWPWDIVRLRVAQENVASGGGGSGRLRGGNTGNEILSGSHIGLPDNSDGVGQISRGAGVLGNALRDGGRALAAAKPVEDFTLYKGELVSASTAAKYVAAYNQDLTTQNQNYQDEAIKTQNWWREYNAGNIYPPYYADQKTIGGDTSFSVPGPDPNAAPSSWLSGVSSFVGGGLSSTSSDDYQVSN